MSIRIGIDAGTSVTKLVAVRDGELIDRLRVDSEPSDSDIYALYESFMTNNNLKDEDIEKINLTGVGATGFNKLIGGKKPSYIHEFDANVTGAKYVAGDRKDFLLISMGTGTSYIHVKDNKATHAGGLGMGGGTVKGLAKYIVGTTDVKTLSELSDAGNLSNINLTMADVSEANFVGLAAELTASNFAKTEADASKADLVRGIYSLVIENIIQTGCMIANQMKIKSVVLIGGLCNSRETEGRLELFKTMYPDIDFVLAKNGSYITAIGTAIAE